MKFQGHLHLDEITLAPSGEWAGRFPGWCFVRVQEGQGYWLEPGCTAAANAGDLLVLSPLRTGVFRASQVGGVCLQYFRFCPELLSGFLTLVERNQLETLAASPRPASCHLPAAHPAARHFAQVSEEAGGRHGLWVRCRILEVTALVFQKEIGVPLARTRGFLPASKRIRVFLNQLTEAEIMDLSPMELATRCGCSVRHFNRLFAANFGLSLRAKQTELRLLKARQLLAETGTAVNAVAAVCGYRHSGLFNAMFRRCFGMTPTEWRKQVVSRSAPTDSPHAREFVTQK
jgi:AraC-like DNA-binding protein